MIHPFFDGFRDKPLSSDESSKLPESKYKDESKPEHYVADGQLVNAVNVALLMGKPLLLTGEPGTGKTQLASRIAWELGNLRLLKFEAKSSSKASDLFYFFNMVGYFQTAQIQKNAQSKEFISYNALGEAIIRTLPSEQLTTILPSDFTPSSPERTVILIDEIDKAPRDFPNDILNELEGLYFKIPELGNRTIEANHKLAPIVIITSNSEKNLPHAFLRRCVFHHINFPESETQLEAIIAKRLSEVTVGSPLIKEMINFFLELRKPESHIRKKPATGELLVWINAIHNLSMKEDIKSLKDSDHIERTLGILVKSVDDLRISKTILEGWKLQQ